MSSTNPNSITIGSATTYQSIIIALVAGGILSIGVLSVIYRRSRRNRLIRALPSDMRLIITSDGRIVSVPRERKKKKEIGKEPVLWDFGLGDRDVDRNVEDGERDSREGVEKVSFGEEKTEERDEPGVMGEIGSEWNPISLAFPPSVDDPKSSRSIEMTVLIAMPEPSHPLPKPIPSHPTTSSSPSSSTTSLSYHKSAPYDYSIVYDPIPDLEDLPFLEFATASIPVSSRSEEESKSLELLRPKDEGGVGVGEPAVEARSERVDGFRSR